ncbi:hypothetical protein J1N35_038921, partial [Gossypium stocksii]
SCYFEGNTTFSMLTEFHGVVEEKGNGVGRLTSELKELQTCISSLLCPFYIWGYAKAAKDL